MAGTQVSSIFRRKEPMRFRWLLAVLGFGICLPQIAAGSCRDVDFARTELLIRSELQASEYFGGQGAQFLPLNLKILMSYAPQGAIISPARFQAMVRAYFEDVRSKKMNVDRVQLQEALEVLAQTCELAQSRRVEDVPIHVPAVWAEVERKRAILKTGYSFGGAVVFLAGFGLAANFVVVGARESTTIKKRKRAPKRHINKAA